jgi:hypothetical protein
MELSLIGAVLSNESMTPDPIEGTFFLKQIRPISLKAVTPCYTRNPGKSQILGLIDVIGNGRAEDMNEIELQAPKIGLVSAYIAMVEAMRRELPILTKRAFLMMPEDSC